MENSSFGRVFSVLSSPTKTFKSIAERPTALVAILLVVVIATGVNFLVFSRVDGEEMVRAQIEKQDRELTDEQMENAVSMGEKMKYIAPAATLVMAPVLMVAFAGVFLVAFKLQGSDIDFRRTLSTYVYGSMPAMVKALLIVPVALSKSEISAQAAQANTVLMSNLAFLAPDDAGPTVLAALSSADVFSVWMIALLAMGFSIVGKVSKGSATLTVLLLWIVGVAVKVGLASLGS